MFLVCSTPRAVGLQEAAPAMRLLGSPGLQRSRKSARPARSAGGLPHLRREMPIECRDGRAGVFALLAVFAQGAAWGGSHRVSSSPGGRSMVFGGQTGTLA